MAAGVLARAPAMFEGMGVDFWLELVERSLWWHETTHAVDRDAGRIPATA